MTVLQDNPPWACLTQQKQGEALAEAHAEAVTREGGTGALTGSQIGRIGVAFLQSEALEGFFGCNISYDFVLRVTF